MNGTKHEQKGFLNGVDRAFSALRLKLKHKDLQEEKRVMLALLTACANLPHVAPARGRELNSKWVGGSRIENTTIQVLKGMAWNVVVVITL